MDCGLIIVGTEILTGKRRDGHLTFMIEALARRGLELAWCRYLGDHPALLAAELRASMARPGVVLCFGGIGATPDDHTRACAAEAAGVPLALHPEAAAVIEARFGGEAHPQRIRMAHLPQGCTLIPNPVNQIAGFSLGDHHFVPGFPQMGQPMAEWVLDRHYAHLHRDEGPVESLLTLPGVSEGQLIEVMERLVAGFPGVALSCLPHMEGDYRETELGVRGERDRVTQAMAWLETALHEAGLGFRPADGDG
jgi:molybdopterin-biosynthesis enzyme MoeA-like protein